MYVECLFWVPLDAEVAVGQQILLKHNHAILSRNSKRLVTFFINHSCILRSSNKTLYTSCVTPFWSLQEEAGKCLVTRDYDYITLPGGKVLCAVIVGTKYESSWFRGHELCLHRGSKPDLTQIRFEYERCHDLGSLTHIN